MDSPSSVQGGCAGYVLLVILINGVENGEQCCDKDYK